VLGAPDGGAPATPEIALECEALNGQWRSRVAHEELSVADLRRPTSSRHDATFAVIGGSSSRVPKFCFVLGRSSSVVIFDRVSRAGLVRPAFFSARGQLRANCARFRGQRWGS
jgi:hypothetical protein